MSEQPTTTISDENVQNNTNPFEDIQAMQEQDFMKRQAEAARRLNTPEETPSEAPDNKRRFSDRAIAAAAGIAVVGGAGIIASEVYGNPEFSETTREYTVQPNDGYIDAANDVTGIENVDHRDVSYHIQTDPANAEVVKDGLQPGEILIIPDEVKR